MLVTYQECGCIALPEDIVSALGLHAGSALSVSYDPDSGIVSLAAAESLTTSEATGAHCRLRAIDK